jgi:hypothetical protein
MFGVTTYYRKQPDGSLSIKMEGVMEGVPLFEQVAIIREVDLHYTWSPFCTESKTLKDINKCDCVGWFVIGAPQFGLSRDGVFRAVGCDTVAEDGSFLIVGQGLHDRPPDIPYDEPYLTEGLEGIEFPKKPTRMGTGRLTLRNFIASIRIISPTACETTLIASIDPHIPLPQVLLDFVTRKICGVVFHKIQVAARKVSKDPIRNQHAIRMRQDKEFYEGWLLPKFESYCDMKNWKLPKVSALDLTEEEQDKELEYLMKHTNQVHLDLELERSDEESTSSISRLTVSTATLRNPLLRYMRESKAKAKAKKALKIELGRIRAENRLKPKHMSEEELLRLEELKEAKERRTKNNGAPCAKIQFEKVQEKHDVSTSFAFQFHEHNLIIMMLVTGTLCLLASHVLSPDFILGKYFDTLKVNQASWSANFQMDFLAVLYICLCAVIHFAFCDIIMIYAFGTLEIGKKAGLQSKKFYSDSVRIFVAGTSTSIAAFGIGKALLSAAFRSTLMYSSRCIQTLIGLLASCRSQIGAHLPSPFLKLAEAMLLVNATFIGSIFSLVFTFIQTSYRVLVSSSRLGRLVQTMAIWMWNLIPYRSSFGRYFHELHHESLDLMPSWRYNAIEFTISIYSHTAVFLLTALILFSITLRSKKTKKGSNISMASDYSQSDNASRPQGTTLDVSGRSFDTVTGDYSVTIIPQPLASRVTNVNRPSLKVQLRKKSKSMGKIDERI